MRKSIVLTLLAVIISTGLMAQTIEDIRDLASKNQWEKAKEGIDKYLAVEKNAKKGDGWYLKSVIYNTIAKDAKLKTLAPDGRMDAFNAYKKYLELDPKAVEGTLNMHATLFDVSFGYLGKGGDDFNAKKYDDALAAFKNAEIVQEYIVQKGLTYGNFAFPAFDTQLYINVAASAVNAKKTDIAVEYYQKIADKKIAGKGYEEIYKYLVDQFDKKGDKANRDKYLALGKELYPDDAYWCQTGLNDVWDDKKKLFAKFEELITGSCNTFVNNYNYSVELYNYAFAQEKRPEDFAEVNAKLPDQLKKTIAISSTSEANMLMCRYQFALINDLLDAYNAIKGVKPDDVKKKADLTAQLNKKYDEVLPYAMAVYNILDAKTTLKAGEKGNFKIACSMLVEYWERKNDKVKMKQYQDKMSSIQ